MKKSIVTTALMMGLFFTSIVSAQVGIGVSPANINPSAQLDVSSTTKGFLPPRMTQEQRNDIPNPAAGLVVWCSNCGSAGEMQVYNGTAWTNMVGGTAAVVPVPLAIGQAYQGGIIVYIDGTGLHGLIAATSDQGTSVTWVNGSYLTTGATGKAIGTGLANTNAIISSQGNTGTYAAKICRDYRGGGYSDWYLPSRDELNQIYINRTAIGSFANNPYWSSTESSDYDAWFQYFSFTYQSYDIKFNTLNVRAVRSF